jgi:hypothetical protein
MPIPKPKYKEKKQDFIQRCMQDPVMNKEYKDVHQRLAVCNLQYDNSKKINSKKTA